MRMFGFAYFNLLRNDLSVRRQSMENAEILSSALVVQLLSIYEKNWKQMPEFEYNFDISICNVFSRRKTEYFELFICLL